MFALASETLRIAFELVTEGAGAEDAMRASWLPGRKDDLLAVDNDGSLVLLVRQYGAEGRTLPSNHRVFAVLPCREYEVRVDNHEFSERYRAVALRPGNEHLLSAFSILIAALISYLPDAPTSRDIDRFMTELIELFDVETEISLERVLGLWGELALMSRTEDPAKWFDAWHAQPNALYDFTFGGINVEVKTALGSRPIHHFSHSQLTQEPTRTYIASLLVHEDRGGKSVTDLVEEISASLALSARVELEDRVIRVFGREVELARDLRFALTGSGMPRFVRTEYVPQVLVSPSQPITEISYRVDLTASLADHGSPTEPTASL